MAKLLKLRRGTTSQHSSFTGAEGEVTVDTTKDTLVVHDGSTAGGHAVAAEDMANVSSASIVGRLGTGSVVKAKLEADIIDGTKLADNAVNSEHYTDGSIDHVHLAADAVDGDNIADDSINSEHYVDASIDHQHLSNDCIDGDNIQDDVINSEHIAAGAVDLEHMSSESVDEDNLKISNSGSNGQYLQKQSGNTGGLTWATVDLSPYAPLASPALTGTATGVNLTLSGNLTVNGTTTTINSTTLSVDDKNIELGSVASPSDTTADGGGWTLKGATDKTFNWVNATDAWTSSEHVHILDDKKLLVGSGSDLEIYHNSSNGNTHIKEGGSGSLVINADDLYIQNADASENIAVFKEDGEVELYHNNFKSFQTDSNGIVTYGPEGGTANVYIYADEGDDNADKWRLQADTSGNFKVGNYSTGSWVWGLTLDGSQNATFVGTVSDSKGNVRTVPATTKTSAHTLIASDTGKVVYISTGGVTIPNSVMSGGDIVTIINNSGSNQTLTQASGLTLYNTADAATGNRTLAGRGMCTIWFQGGSTAYVSGAGIS